MSSLPALLTPAFDARAPWLTGPHDTAFRLFNGFTEGLPALVLEVYADTLVLFDRSEGAAGDEALAKEALAFTRARLPWLTCALWKRRGSANQTERNGTVLFGATPARRVQEDGVTYALDLTLNQDTSFYVDTRELRRWAKASLSGQRVLNCFAYTGSLGVAAHAGGAKEVMHTDLNRAFLNVAKDSYSMNRWPIAKRDFRAGDFFDVAGALKRDERLFDCVFVDPPFFSVTPKGRVDAQQELARVLNKVRPLVAHGGHLVVVNNALFVSGASFLELLKSLAPPEYLTVEQHLDVPADVRGIGTASYPADPAPFNHPTKIAVLSVRRKDTRS